METLTVGASRLLGGATASSSSSSSSSSVRIFHSPGSLPAFGARKGVSVIRCQAQKNKKSPSSGGGFGAKTVAKPTFDAALLLRRSEQVYTRLVAEHTHEGDVREFVICVRQKGSKSHGAMGDWLPVAELALVSEWDASIALPIALPILCREVAECAGKGAPSLRTIPRNNLEYAYEPAEAFYEFVLGSGNGSQPLANAECPYSVLGLGKGASTSQVRSAYRTLAAKFHPDRQAAEEQKTAEEEFKRVTRAYDQIKRTGLADDGEIASYASLGGTARNSLSEPINMTSQSMQAKLPGEVQAAVRPLDSDIINRFLARSCARQAQAVAV
ncbi:hypothetical protein M758_7G144500 [Ceratodon purpureus]|uniref:J domain-containing protein n=1 Tax=Ceratodon purpureus TaxID=3225 RepID=A0A8T0H9Q9_CERPU|nr:hypothetical protein KC19_7G133500 [Ceratodon purpureus]KAG0611496.1 hypothetical protein M758_7G144500 [Ceratodon purpureus]